MRNFPAVIGLGSFGTILQLRLELRNLKPRRLVTSYRKAFRLWRPAIPPGHHAFICNICGGHAFCRTCANLGARCAQLSAM